LSADGFGRDGIDARMPDGDLSFYLSKIASDSLPPMTRKMEEEVFGELHNGTQEQSDNARDIIARSNLRFVINVAKFYKNCGIEMADLVGAGNVGLAKSIDRFDPNKGFKFITYSVWWIRQEIFTLIDQNCTLKIPVNVQGNRRKILKAMKAPTDRTSSKSFNDAAKSIGLTKDQTYNAAMFPLSVISMDAPMSITVGSDGAAESNRHDVVSDRSESDLDRLTRCLMRDDIMGVLEKCLDSRQKTIMVLHYGLSGELPRTLEEIGSIFKITRERIRQIRNDAINKVRKSSMLKDWAFTS
jgi:RNA polymerase primary sigma factor